MEHTVSLTQPQHLTAAQKENLVSRAKLNIIQAEAALEFVQSLPVAEALQPLGEKIIQLEPSIEPHQAQVPNHSDNHKGPKPGSMTEFILARVQAQPTDITPIIKEGMKAFRHTKFNNWKDMFYNLKRRGLLQQVQPRVFRQPNPSVLPKSQKAA
jgi:hypothetical protein